MRLVFLLVVGLFAGCTATDVGISRDFDPDRRVREFALVVSRVEPVAEAKCRQARVQRNCDFQIVVDERVELAPNAFQTIDSRGRPVLIFTLSMLVFVENVDELALVMSHEAAHHIQGHLQQKIRLARRQAERAAAQAVASGRGPVATEIAIRRAAIAGSLKYSMQYELEADLLGAEIAKRAGFDPVRGADFFDRLPNARGGAWASHPANDDRKKLIAQAVAGL